MITGDDLPPPCDLGSPARYVAWRRGQGAAWAVLQEPHPRWVVLALPTGVGKSLVVVTHATFTGQRMVALTRTVGLQNQYLADHQEIGMRDVRGMSHYECLAEGGMCDTGSCIDGGACHLKDRGCLYFDAVRTAEGAGLVITNYDFWLTRRRTGRGLGKVDTLVADEAHEILDAVTDYLSVELRGDVVRLTPAMGGWGMEEWRAWARVAAGTLRERMAHTPKVERRRLRNLALKLDTLAVAEGEWVVAETGRGYTLSPLWPAPYLESWLWQGVKEIVLASATIRPYTLTKMGLSAEDYRFVEIPSPIPAQRRPVVHVVSGVRVSHRTSEEDWQHVVDLMDSVIDGRPGRKGIVHSVSYQRARAIMASSRHRGRMLGNLDSTDAAAVIARFKSAPPSSGLVLVTPSTEQGYDFAGLEDATYQILPKIPFADLRDPLMKARYASDKDWYNYVALQRIVQMAGRVCRGPEDIGETICLDDQFAWLYGYHKRHTPRYFQLAVRRASVVPSPPSLA